MRRVLSARPGGGAQARAASPPPPPPSAALRETSPRVAALVRPRPPPAQPTAALPESARGSALSGLLGRPRRVRGRRAGGTIDSPYLSRKAKGRGEGARGETTRVSAPPPPLPPTTNVVFVSNRVERRSTPPPPDVSLGHSQGRFHPSNLFCPPALTDTNCLRGAPRHTAPPATAMARTVALVVALAAVGVQVRRTRIRSARVIDRSDARARARERPEAPLCLFFSRTSAHARFFGAPRSPPQPTHTSAQVAVAGSMFTKDITGIVNMVKTCDGECRRRTRGRKGGGGVLSSGREAPPPPPPPMRAPFEKNRDRRAAASRLLLSVGQRGALLRGASAAALCGRPRASSRCRGHGEPAGGAGRAPGPPPPPPRLDGRAAGRQPISPAPRAAPAAAASMPAGESRAFVARQPSAAARDSGTGAS